MQISSFYKLILVIAFLSAFQINCNAQVTIQMRKEGGVFTVPCTVNGLKLRFIFDTGASNVSISMTEALFMLKNDYLNTDDIVGKEYYSDATGYISEGTKIILKKIEFNGIVLNNVEASVVHNLEAPLLLGQSAMSQIGTFQFDPNSGTITILKVPYQETRTTTYAPKNQPPVGFDKKSPYTDISGTTKYRTKIICSTLLYDAYDGKGKKVKEVIGGESIEVVDDRNYGDFVLAKFDGYFGYIRKAALAEFQ
jgi:clan AA aspartic protease (TIGR02281 family)